MQISWPTMLPRTRIAAVPFDTTLSIDINIDIVIDIDIAHANSHAHAPSIANALSFS
jgi:hypothetical protein